MRHSCPTRLRWISYRTRIAAEIGFPPTCVSSPTLVSSRNDLAGPYAEHNLRLTASGSPEADAVCVGAVCAGAVPCSDSTYSRVCCSHSRIDSLPNRAKLGGSPVEGVWSSWYMTAVSLG